MRDWVFSGADVKEALDVASRTLGVPCNDLPHIVIEEGHPAALGRPARPARIAVLAETAPAPAFRSKANSLEMLVSDAMRALAQSSGASLRADVSRTEQALLISIESDEIDFLWGENGEVFDALTLLLQRMVAREGFRGTVRVRNSSVLERRKQRLERTALDAAEKARANGMALCLSGLNSFERRIVHVALAGVEGIRTRSEGEGGERRLVIEPKARNAPDG